MIADGRVDFYTSYLNVLPEDMLFSAISNWPQRGLWRSMDQSRQEIENH